MLVSMLAPETRSSCYLITKSWFKAEFSAGRLTTENFIRYPASSIQLRYQLRQRQTSFCHLSSIFCSLDYARDKLLSSVLCLLSSVFCPLSSVFCPLSSVFCLLSSIFCLLSSVICPLSSVRYLCPVPVPRNRR